jgi:hypothetical protein
MPIDKVVLAGDVVHIERRFADELVGIVELVRLREMGDVAGVDHERGLRRHRFDLGDGFAQRAERVGVGRLVEADVAVADLEEGEGWSLGGEHLVEQAQGFRHAARQGPQHASPGPDHALEGAPAGDSSFFDVGCGFSLQGLVFAHRNLLQVVAHLS